MWPKFFKLLLISALLLINAALYYLYFKPERLHHTAFVPADASLVVSLNTRGLSEKLLYTALFREQEFSALLERKQPASSPMQLGKLDNGLRFYGTITFFVRPLATGTLNGVLLDVSDPARLERFLAEEGYELSMPLEGIRFASGNGKSSCVAFTDEVAVWLNARPEQEVRRFATELLARPKGETTLIIPSGSDLYIHNTFDPASNPFFESGTCALSFGDTSIVLDGNWQVSSGQAALFTAAAQRDRPDPNLFKGTLRVQLHARLAPLMSNLLQRIPGKDSLFFLSDTLAMALGEKLVFQLENAKVERIEQTPPAGRTTRILPRFYALLEVADTALLHQQLRRGVAEGQLQKEPAQGEYTYRKDDFYLALRVSANELTLTTGDTFPEGQLATQFYGFPNWIYFDIRHFFRTVETPSFATEMALSFVKSLIDIERGYFYVDNVSSNQVSWKGHLLYAGNADPLIQSLRFAEKLSAVFMPAAPEVVE